MFRTKKFFADFFMTRSMYRVSLKFDLRSPCSRLPKAGEGWKIIGKKKLSLKKSNFFFWLLRVQNNFVLSIFTCFAPQVTYKKNYFFHTKFSFKNPTLETKNSDFFEFLRDKFFLSISFWWQVVNHFVAFAGALWRI